MARRGACLAAHRGVDVRIYVPDPSNHFIADLARGQPLRDAAAGRERDPLHRRNVHAKIVVVDDAFAMVGSVNIDPRSLFLNSRRTAIVYGADQVGAIASWIETLRDTKQKGVPAVSTFRDTLEGAARILDPLL